jgi:hypothetical protein
MRVAFVLVGIGFLGLGAWALVAQVEPAAWPGILLWMAGALVIHDGVIAPATALAALIARRAGRRVPYAAIAGVQAIVVTVLLVAAVAVPEILKQRIGSANATILPLDYSLNLALFCGVMLVIAVAIIVVPLVMARRKTS